MAIPKISVEKQLELRNMAKSELIRLMEIQSDDETTELLNRFKNKYNICETVYKVILKEHQKFKKKTLTNDYMKVIMTQVPHALTFAGYSFDKNLLNELFGSKGKKGMTVKKLRDAVTHGIDEKAISEISKREAELFSYMNDFLNIIESFDNAA